MSLRIKDPKHKNALINVLFLFLIFVIGILFFYKLWFGNGIIYSDSSDIVSQFLSSNNILQQSLAGGEGIPFWDPTMNSGQPGMANPQMMFLFPLSWLYFALPLDKATNLFVLFNYLIAGIGMYVFCARKFTSPIASFFCAVSYMLSYRYLCLIFAGHLPKITIVALLPLIFLALGNVLGKPNIRNLICLSIMTALAVTQGDMQVLYYIVLCVPFYIIYRIRSGTVSNPKKVFITLLAAGAIGMLLSAPVLLPRIEYLSLSSRMVFSYDFFKELAPGVGDLKTLLDPLDQNGRRSLYWESNFYFGIWLWPFVLIALIFGNKKCRWIFGSILIMYFVCFDTVFLRLLYEYFPGFRLFRQTPRVLVIAQFLMTILAGSGVEIFMKNLSQKKHCLTLSGLLIAAGAACGGAAWRFQGDILPLCLNLFLSALIAFCFLGKMRKAAIVIICLLPVLDSGFRMMPRIQTRGLEDIFPKLELYSLLKANSGHMRIFSVGPWCINYGAAGYHGLKMVNGYSGINLKHYIDYLSLIEGGNPEDISDPAIITHIQKIAKKNLFYQLNVGYILANKPYPFEDFLDCRRAGYFPHVPFYDIFQGTITVPVYIWRVRNPSPYGFYASSVKLFTQSEDVLKELSAEDDAKKACVLWNGQWDGTFDCSGGDIQTTHNGTNRYIYQLKSNGNNFLVLSQIWYPGWKAYLDGVEIDLYRTNHTFIGCKVGEGDHRLVLEMTSPQMKLGLKYFCAGLVLLILVALGNKFELRHLARNILERV